MDTNISSQAPVGVAQWHYAGLVRRFVASVIDGLLIAIPCLVLAAFVVLTVYGVDNMPAATDSVFQTAVGLIFVAYTTVTEALWGQTLGKRLMHIRVVSDDLQLCSPKQAVIRNLGRVLDGVLGIVALALILLTPKKQRVGDLLAHTIVVSA